MLTNFVLKCAFILPPPLSFTPTPTSYSGEKYVRPVVVWIFRRDQICTIKTTHSSVTTSIKQVVDDEMRGGREGMPSYPMQTGSISEGRGGGGGGGLKLNFLIKF
jgi:hypothetical protein